MDNLESEKRRELTYNTPMFQNETGEYDDIDLSAIELPDEKITPEPTAASTSPTPAPPAPTPQVPEKQGMFGGQGAEVDYAEDVVPTMDESTVFNKDRTLEQPRKNSFFSRLLGQGVERFQRTREQGLGSNAVNQEQMALDSEGLDKVDPQYWGELYWDGEEVAMSKMIKRIEDPVQQREAVQDFKASAVARAHEVAGKMGYSEELLQGNIALIEDYFDGGWNAKATEDMTTEEALGVLTENEVDSAEFMDDFGTPDIGKIQEMFPNYNITEPGLIQTTGPEIIAASGGAMAKLGFNAARVAGGMASTAVVGLVTEPALDEITEEHPVIGFGAGLGLGLVEGLTFSKLLEEGTDKLVQKMSALHKDVPTMLRQRTINKASQEFKESLEAGDLTNVDVREVYKEQAQVILGKPNLDPRQQAAANDMIMKIDQAELAYATDVVTTIDGRLVGSQDGIERIKPKIIDAIVDYDSKKGSFEIDMKDNADKLRSEFLQDYGPEAMDDAVEAYIQAAARKTTLGVYRTSAEEQLNDPNVIRGVDLSPEQTAFQKGAGAEGEVTEFEEASTGFVKAEAVDFGDPFHTALRTNMSDQDWNTYVKSVSSDGLMFKDYSPVDNMVFSETGGIRYHGPVNTKAKIVNNNTPTMFKPRDTDNPMKIVGNVANRINFYDKQKVTPLAGRLVERTAWDKDGTPYKYQGLNENDTVKLAKLSGFRDEDVKPMLDEYMDAHDELVNEVNALPLDDRATMHADLTRAEQTYADLASSIERGEQVTNPYSGETFKGVKPAPVKMGEQLTDAEKTNLMSSARENKLAAAYKGNVKDLEAERKELTKVANSLRASVDAPNISDFAKWHKAGLVDDDAMYKLLEGIPADVVKRTKGNMDIDQYIQALPEIVGKSTKLPARLKSKLRETLVDIDAKVAALEEGKRALASNPKVKAAGTYDDVITGGELTSREASKLVADNTPAPDRAQMKFVEDTAAYTKGKQDFLAKYDQSVFDSEITNEAARKLYQESAGANFLDTTKGFKQLLSLDETAVPRVAKRQFVMTGDEVRENLAKRRVKSMSKSGKAALNSDEAMGGALGQDVRDMVTAHKEYMRQINKHINNRFNPKGKNSGPENMRNLSRSFESMIKTFDELYAEMNNLKGSPYQRGAEKHILALKDRLAKTNTLETVNVMSNSEVLKQAYRDAKNNELGSLNRRELQGNQETIVKDTMADLAALNTSEATTTKIMDDLLRMLRRQTRDYESKLRQTEIDKKVASETEGLEGDAAMRKELEVRKFEELRDYMIDDVKSKYDLEDTGEAIPDAQQVHIMKTVTKAVNAMQSKPGTSWTNGVNILETTTPTDLFDTINRFDSLSMPGEIINLPKVQLQKMLGFEPSALVSNDHAFKTVRLMRTLSDQLDKIGADLIKNNVPEDNVINSIAFRKGVNLMKGYLDILRTGNVSSRTTRDMASYDTKAGDLEHLYDKLINTIEANYNDLIGKSKHRMIVDQEMARMLGDAPTFQAKLGMIRDKGIVDDALYKEMGDPKDAVNTLVKKLENKGCL